MTQKVALLTSLSFGAFSLSVAGGVYYLLRDKTIEERLNREGVNLIKSETGYQIAFEELKKNSTFIQDIKNWNKQINEESSFFDGRKTLDAWCNENIKKPLNIEKLIEKVKNYCKSRPSTIGDKLNGKLLTEGWNKKLESLKESEKQKSTQLLEDLKEKDSEINTLDLEDKAKVEKALKDWCNENASKSLILDVDNTIFEKVKNRCTNN